MIQRISEPKVFSGLNTQHNKENKVNNVNTTEAARKNGFKNYADSFVKHSAQSAPMLLGLTALWSLIDNASHSISIKKAFKNNFVNFFIPVTAASSVILSVIENRNRNNTEKTDKIKN